MSDAAQLGRIALLVGGWASERDVSLDGGEAVYQALHSQGVEIDKIDVQRDIASVLSTAQASSNNRYDKAFIMVHGQGGEDGGLQHLCEILQLPYTGCRPLASAICMDKLMTKRIWRGAGLSTPQHALLDDGSDFQQVAEQLGLPLIVKPAEEGSSIGLSKVHTVAELSEAYAVAKQHAGNVFAEQWVEGSEYTVSLVGDEVLPAIRVEAASGFYDYHAKYQANDTQYHCPSGLDADKEQALQKLAKIAFSALKGSGWGRIDFMQDQQGKNWLIEANTVPGMTSHSLVPMAAKQAGMSFEQLVLRIAQEAHL